jgi:hypothetical protein
MWFLLLAQAHPLVVLVVAALMVISGVLTVIGLIIKNWCRIIGALIVAFQSDDKRRADGLDLARIGQLDRKPPRPRLPARRRKDDENAGQVSRPPPGGA